MNIHLKVNSSKNDDFDYLEIEILRLLDWIDNKLNALPRGVKGIIQWIVSRISTQNELYFFIKSMEIFLLKK